MGIDLEKHDLAKDPPSRELLERLIDDDRPMEFLNPRSPAYKDRNLGAKKLSKKQVIALMMEDPNLIRRPIVLRGSKDAIFGFDAAGYDALK
jgi:arsenate reductase